LNEREILEKHDFGVLRKVVRIIPAKPGLKVPSGLTMIAEG